MADEALPLQERLRQLIKYDPDTGYLYWLERPRSIFSSDARQAYWNKRFAGQQVGGIITQRGYTVRTTTLKLPGEPVFGNVHRIVWAMFNGSIPEGLEIDHIDGNPLNNRIENLRAVKHAENVRNAKRRIDNRSGRTGVTPIRGKWWARGRFNGKHYGLGLFERFEDAVSAREAWERQHGFHPNHGRVL